MKRHSILIIILVLACLMMFSAVIVQSREFFRLHDEHQRLLARLTGPADNPVLVLSKKGAPAPPMAGITVSPDLLRLRNQVNLLTRRRQELARIHSENERLRLTLAKRQTNP